VARVASDGDVAYGSCERPLEAARLGPGAHTADHEEHSGTHTKYAGHDDDDDENLEK
jgi:hypothetical protein